MKPHKESMLFWKWMFLAPSRLVVIGTFLWDNDGFYQNAKDTLYSGIIKTFRQSAKKSHIDTCI